MSFGSGDMAQLGLGQADNVRERKKPTLIKSLEDHIIAKISVGALHNAVIEKTGELWTWGCNDDLALGREVKTEGDEWIPAKIVDFNEYVTQVCCGASHTIALTNTGHVYTWGAYRDGQGLLGFDKQEEKQKNPTLLTQLQGQKVVEIACGDHHDLVLTDRGHVWQWGVTGFGIRGSDRLKKVKLAPQRVIFKGKLGTNMTIKNVFAGGSSSFAVTVDGQLYAWGPNNYGQCGIPPTRSLKVKKPKKNEKKENESQPSSDESNKSSSLPTETTTTTTTKNEKKGNEEEENIALRVPTLIPDLPPIAKVAAGPLHTLFLSTDNTVYSVGKGQDGRLGRGDKKYSMSVGKVDIKLTTDDVVVNISCGEAHSLAVTKKGHVYSWGSGDLMQLGLDQDEDTPHPTVVTSKLFTQPPRLVLQAGGGSQHSLILVADLHPQPKKVVVDNKSNSDPTTTTTTKSESESKYDKNNSDGSTQKDQSSSDQTTSKMEIEKEKLVGTETNKENPPSTS